MNQGKDEDSSKYKDLNIDGSTDMVGVNESDNNNTTLKPYKSNLVAEYCASLSLSFEKALAADFYTSAPDEDNDFVQELCLKRIIYHRTFESVRNQILWLGMFFFVA